MKLLLNQSKCSLLQVSILFPISWQQIHCAEKLGWSKQTKNGKGSTWEKKMQHFCFQVLSVDIGSYKKKGFDVRHMSYLFGISPSHVSRVFTMWVNILHACLKTLLRWPTQDIARANLPKAFATFPRTRCARLHWICIWKAISACSTETNMVFLQAFQHCKVADRNTSMWNNYISVNSICPGGVSDVEIVKKSQFLDLIVIEPADDVMADRGFNIRHLLLPKRAILNIPAFSKGSNLSLKKAAVRHSRSIASVRIHVERAIRRMKCFKILSGSYQWSWDYV